MNQHHRLLDSAGTFTVEELLALRETDLSSTDITAPDGTQHLFLHNIDFDAKICLNIIQTIDKCGKAKLPIVKVVKAEPPLPSKHYQLHFATGWERLEKNARNAFQHQLTKKYFYSEEIKAWMFIQSQFTQSELDLLSHPVVLDYKNKESVQHYADLFNLFIERLIKHIQSASFKKKIRDRNYTKSANKKACIRLFNHLIAKFAKVLVVRIDFSLKREIGTIMKHASTMGIPHSRNDLCILKKYMAKFKNNFRNNNLLNAIEGYIFQYEYSHATGFHIHAYFFFDGNKHREDISIAQYISDYWKKITQNQGSTYICNMKKEQYRYCGIGMIHYSDTEKQKFLIQTFDYICKADQFFTFAPLKNTRRFQCSELPKPKANSGRSRTLISNESH